MRRKNALKNLGVCLFTNTADFAPSVERLPKARRTAKPFDRALAGRGRRVGGKSAPVLCK